MICYRCPCLNVHEVSWKICTFSFWWKIWKARFFLLLFLLLHKRIRKHKLKSGTEVTYPIANWNERKGKKIIMMKQIQKSAFACKQVFTKMFYSQLIHIEYVWVCELLSIDVKGQVSFHISFPFSFLGAPLLSSIFHLCLPLARFSHTLWMCWAQMQTQNKVA